MVNPSDVRENKETNIYIKKCKENINIIRSEGGRSDMGCRLCYKASPGLLQHHLPSLSYPRRVSVKSVSSSAVVTLRPQ